MSGRVAIFVACLISITTDIPSASEVHGGRLVYPKLVESRLEEGNTVIKITEDLTLTLSRSRVLADTFVVRTISEDESATERNMRARDIEKHLYHDEDHVASVTVHTKDGLRLEGILGDRRRIRPAPELQRSDDSHVPHLLYQVDEGVPHRRDLVIPLPEVFVEERRKERRYTAKIPDIIYPELFIVSDSSHAEAFEGNTTAAAEYMAILVNAVNLRFLSISNPRVQLRLVGFELDTSLNETYLVYPGVPGNYINGIKTLANFTVHINQRWEYSKYDMVHLFTSRSIMEYRKGKFSTRPLGYANLGQPCLMKRTSISKDVAGTHSGVHALAHEMGHVLGCPHDGEGALRPLLQGPGAKACPNSDGYIMSYEFDSPNRFKFSSCCNAMISYIVTRWQQSCLLEQNVKEKTIADGRFPGTVLLPREQCKLHYAHSKIREVGTSRLATECKIECFVRRSTYNSKEIDKVIDALDGTICAASGKACYNGICGERPPMELPDDERSQ